MANLYKNSEITTSRINVFLGWENFNPKGNVAPGRMDQNLCSRLWTGHNRTAVQLAVATTDDNRLANFSSTDLNKLSFKTASVGDKFGPTFSTHVFRLDVTVPDNFDRSLPLHLIWDSNSEAMVMSEDGTPIQGLVGGDHWARRADCLLFPPCDEKDSPGPVKKRVYVEISCNGLFGAGRGGDIEPPDMDRTYTLDECCLAVFDPKAWALIHDVTLMQGLAKHLPDTPRKSQALQIANDVVNEVDVADPLTYEAGRKVASKFLEARNGGGQSHVTAMLHSHIDLAWLWPMAATPAKGARTFATVLRLMEKYPECVYVQSQAQLYDWVKSGYPSLWKELCERVREGRFLPVGGTWVEMDCNIPSGEALVRQFVYGQQFFEDNFEIRCKEFWLPDTFGYASQLPQIMKGCGIDYFMTQKLSWNLFNKFPHSSFIWEGLDGSRVLAHMPPADTYNSQAFPEEILMSAHKNKDAAVFDQSILLVGHGDGGGGPSPAMLESLQRMEDVDGVPKVKFGTPTQFFEALAEKEDKMPRWVGELYFELHRGTYTSQAKVKKSNRQCEFLLRTVEMCSSLALLHDLSGEEGFDYPKESLSECWKIVLKNAFHDTLPGSSIGMVYEETDRDYALVQSTCEELIRISLKALESLVGFCENGMKKMKTASGSVRTSDGRSSMNDMLVVLAMAPILSRTKGICVFDVAHSAVKSMKDVLTQVVYDRWDDGNDGDVENEKDDHVLISTAEMGRGFGISHLPRLLGAEDKGSAVQVGKEKATESSDLFKYVLSNDLVTVALSEHGRVTSMKVKCADGTGSREVLAQDGNGQGFGNQFVLYDDVPMFWCAWDSEVYSYEKKGDIVEVVESKIVEEGPLRCTVYMKYKATKDGSTIEQYVSLRAGSARLDFDTKVDWKERRKILRVLFETQVRSLTASYDSQFGFVQRPTTFNHSWDVAKFEVVGHQFCDLSEHGFGVALMSDCKYGYSVRDATMRLSLLRASKSPDDTADIGVHHFRYSLLGHWGNFPNVGVMEEAAELNQPVVLQRWALNDIGARRMTTANYGIGLCDKGEVTDGGTGGVMLECVGVGCFKKAERSDEMVLRLYEAMGARGTAYIKIPDGFIVSEAKACNMLEDAVVCSKSSSAEPVDEEEIIVCGGERKQLKLYFTPFQVRTVLLKLKLQ